MTTSRELLVKQTEGKPGQVYYPIYLRSTPVRAPGPREVTVRIQAAALNHRDLFIRQHLYPGIDFDKALLADGCGVVVAAGSDVKRIQVGEKVVVAPMRGWKKEVSGPDGPFHVAGGTKASDSGTARDYLVLDEEDVEPAPAHLTPAQAAAFSLAGLTGWRALVTKSDAAAPGQNILVTGIGGGVALVVLQLAVAFGANVWVTSSSEDKITKAKELGAKGGVSYKSKTWEKDLKALLPKDRPFLDAVIDGAGGDIVSKSVKLLRAGGVISQYGMTLGPKMEWTMAAVLQNIDLRGSTMGSRKEFRDMWKFVGEKKLQPIISRTVKGLDNLEEINQLFEEMKKGAQFGKLVIEIDSGAGSPARL